MYVAKVSVLPAKTTNCDEGCNGPVLLHMQEMELGRRIRTTVFCDTGANVSLLTHWLARKLGLEGTPIKICVQFATKEPEILDTFIYKLTLYGNGGLKKKITFLGVKDIASIPERVNVDAAYEVFPFVEQGDLERPTAAIGVLIGLDNVEFMPTGGALEDGHRVNGLQCMKSAFGSGWVLGGHHPGIKNKAISMSDTTNQW